MHFPAVFFGTLREHYVMLFSVAGGVALMAGFVGAWIGSHLASRKSARHVAKEVTSELSAAPHLQQIMQAVEVLSVEVERLSEGHRYIARLMAERAERDRLASLPLRERKSEHITPH